MGMATRETVLEALSKIAGPKAGDNVVGAGIVSGIAVSEGHVSFALEVDPAHGAAMEPIRRKAEAAVLALPNVTSVSAVLTAHRDAPAEQTKAGPARRPRPDGPLAPGIKSIIAVASGKGGVGKSTVAVNLALGLARLGLATGMLDADIYGPSLPRMLGVSGRPNSPDGKRLEPMLAHGLKVMSIGFLVAEDTAMIWRGPMVMGAIEQMLRDVNWGELEVLVVDLPPGTGDAQLTLAQRVPLTGVVIVSTPQDVALTDVRRGIKMFRDVDVPVLGVIENMSYFVCPDCGHRSDIFNHGGARRTADELETDFLGEIPLDMAIRETSDDGEPIVGSRPESPQAEIYRKIAERVGDKIAEALSGGARAAPRMVIQ